MITSAAPQYLMDIVRPNYKEMHRFYHTWRHIESMFTVFHMHFGTDMRPEELVAILYHDAVYHPWSKTNEEDSCKLMRVHRPQYYPKVEDSFLTLVDEIIMATKHDGDLPESSFRIVDIDLSILGKPTAVYDEYVANTRKEYAQYSDDEWKQGRTTFLEGMLAKQKIYNTEIIKKAYEESARNNMQRELTGLK